MEGTVEFRLLGPLEVRAGDVPLPLGGPKQRAVLALLLLNANRVVARERLVDDLWGESPPEAVVAVVQVYVSRLRKVLPSDALVTRPPGYMLEVEPTTIDLARFERLVSEARGADPERASDLLREALELWRGPALAEFEEEPFARLERERLERLRLEAVEARIDADLALGRHTEVVGELETLAAQEPHRERLHAQLMLALYRSGRQAEALAAYRRVRAALDELGIEPSSTLKQLEQKILRHDSSLDVARDRRLFPEGQVPLAAAFVPASPFPFVGRERELTALRAALEGAESGAGGFVVVSGEAGAGKTRLIRDVAQDAARRDMLVLHGSSDPAVMTPYQPVREWLAFLLRVCDRHALDECVGDERLRLLLELTHPRVAPLPERGDPEAERYELQTAAAELVSAISRLHPLLLVADDVHWADTETLHLLRRLARVAPESRVLVLAGVRDPGEEIGPTLAETLADLSRLDGVIRLRLGNLNDEEVGAFLRASAGAEPTEDLVAAIRELTDGTPLLVCELWRDLRDTGGVEVEHSIRLTRPVAELRTPERIRDIVRQRLTRLAPATTAVLDVAAVAGQRLEPRVLGEAAALELEALADALDESSLQGIVEQLPGPASYRFTHELVRRAVYDRISGIRRAELHLRVGEALERVHAADPATVIPELAHHFTLAAPVGGTRRAVDYNVQAAKAAIAAAAFEEGAARLGSALELGIADAGERARVQVEQGWLLAEIGRLPEARDLLTEAHETATRLGDPGLAAHARVEEAWQMHRHAVFDADGVRSLALEAIATFDELGDTRGLAKARNLLAIAYDTGSGRYGAALAELEQALLDAEACGDAFIRDRVITRLVMNLTSGPTPVEEAIERCEELRRAGSGRPVLEARIERCQSQLCAMAARADEARDHERRASAVLDRLPYREDVASRRFVANTHLLLGETAAAERQLLVMWERFGDESERARSYMSAFTASMLALLCCDAGRWDDAECWLARAAGVPVPAASPPGMLRPAVGARIAAHRGELDEARRAAKQAVELADRTDSLNWRARVWLALAEVLRTCGRTEEAGGAIETAIRLYEHKGNVAAAESVRSATRQTASPADGGR
jgi:DNA-binding SARP family transcriptional activator/type II secretory pathway predicted ATPase ExeA